MAHILRRDHVLVDHDVTALQSVGVILQRITYFILNAMLVVLAARFVLRLLGANPANDFAQFIYQLTSPLVTPFSGIFGPVSSSGVAAVEVSTLIAMLVFGVLAYALARFIGILTTTET